MVNFLRRLIRRGSNDGAPVQGPDPAPERGADQPTFGTRQSSERLGAPVFSPAGETGGAAVLPLPPAPDIINRFVLVAYETHENDRTHVGKQSPTLQRQSRAKPAVPKSGMPHPMTAPTPVQAPSAGTCAIGSTVTYVLTDTVSSRTETKVLVGHPTSSSNEISTAGTGIGQHFLNKRVGDQFSFHFFGYWREVKILHVVDPMTVARPIHATTAQSHVSSVKKAATGGGMLNSGGPLYRPTAAVPSTGVVASRKGKKYHLPTCQWAKLIAPSNRVSYASISQAHAAYRRPCGDCLWE
jgi:hypothetical protein